MLPGPGESVMPGTAPRFLLPAVLLALPVARLLAPAAGRGAGPAGRGADRGHDVVRPLRDGDREVDAL